ncbi:TIGR01777 family oxidoreductase [Agrococcus versicolor]|uniref:TIGR01777 family oxidoreductase n=1 Tax=Agrococcus versicolor TaxID=501482 RepID=A0ABP5MGQ2_9MICO
MSGRVVLAGGSGFIGGAIAARMAAEGREVRTIGRGPSADARWGDRDGIARALDGASLVVNLAGRSIACRFTDANRAEILDSRVDTTRELGAVMATVASPPPLWMNASTASAYSTSTEQPRTETDPLDEEGFSEDVTRLWEEALAEAELPGTRRVPMRITVALGAEAPATQILFRLARLGAGGAQHDGPWFPHARYRGVGVAKDDPRATAPSQGHRTGGRQRFSWMHVDDVVGAIEHVEQHPEIDGPVNFAAPGPVTNAELMALLRSTVGMPIGIPAWRFMLEPAMAVLGTESELVLKSRWVLPGVLTDTGYVFRHPTLRGALADVWSEMRAR